MASVVVEEAELRTGGLPPVCAVTGMLGTDWLPVRYRTTARWTFLLILCGFVPFVIAYAFTTTRVAGVVPVTAAVHRTALRLRRATAALVAGSMVLVLSAAAVGGAAAVALGLLAAASFLGAAFAQLLLGARAHVPGHIRRGPWGHYLVLEAHPAFVEAVDRRQQDQKEQTEGNP